MLLVVSNRKTKSGLSNTSSHKTRSRGRHSGCLVLTWQFNDKVKDWSFFSFFTLTFLAFWLLVSSVPGVQCGCPQLQGRLVRVLVSFSSLGSGSGPEELGMAGGLSSQLLGIDQLWKKNKNKYMLNHRHKRKQMVLRVSCVWAVNRVLRACVIQCGRAFFRYHSSNGADHYQSLCVTSKTRFRESRFKSCLVGMVRRKEGGKVASTFAPVPSP